MHPSASASLLNSFDPIHHIGLCLAWLGLAPFDSPQLKAFTQNQAYHQFSDATPSYPSGVLSDYTSSLLFHTLFKVVS